MSIDAMKQALEALLEHGSAYLGHDLAYKSAITALRAAIEQWQKPRQWQGLTDEERTQFKRLGLVGVEIIEAKLKEKNT